MKTLTVQDALGKDHVFSGDEYVYQITPQNQLFIRHKPTPAMGSRQGDTVAVFFEPIWMKLDA